MLRASPSYFLRGNHQGETKPGHGAESRVQAGYPQLTALGDARIREFQKNIYFCFIDYTKMFVWKILREMGIPAPYLSSEKPVCRS